MDISVHPVRAWRLAQKTPVRLEDLAARVGTTKANLSRIETRKQAISDELLPKLMAETGIPAGRLRPDLAKLFNIAPRKRHRARAA
jgi:transcriptional regulator with XRE-family HTH domain